MPYCVDSLIFCKHLLESFPSSMRHVLGHVTTAELNKIGLLTFPLNSQNVNGRLTFTYVFSAPFILCSCRSARYIILLSKFVLFFDFKTHLFFCVHKKKVILLKIFLHWLVYMIDDTSFWLSIRLPHLDKHFYNLRNWQPLMLRCKFLIFVWENLKNANFTVYSVAWM